MPDTNEAPGQKLEQRLKEIVKYMEDPHKEGRCYATLAEYMQLVRQSPQRSHKLYMDAAKDFNW